MEKMFQHQGLTEGTVKVTIPQTQPLYKQKLTGVRIKAEPT